MKILVVGSGGREHALIKSLKKNPQVEIIYALHGNGGGKRRGQRGADRDPEPKRHMPLAVRRGGERRLQKNRQQIRRRKDQPDRSGLKAARKQHALGIGIHHARAHPVKSLQQ